MKGTTNSSTMLHWIIKLFAFVVASAVLGSTLLSSQVYASAVDDTVYASQSSDSSASSDSEPTVPGISAIQSTATTRVKEDADTVVPGRRSGEEELDSTPITTVKEKEQEEVKTVVTDPNVDFVYCPDIPLSQELQQYTFDMSNTYGIDYTLVLAMMWRESNFNPNAVGTNSNGTRDSGLMQINDVNRSWLQRDLGVTNLLDPAQNILAGVHMLGTMASEYGSHNALLAYQYGEYGMQIKLSQGVTTNTQVEKLYAKQAELTQLILASQNAPVVTNSVETL